MGATEPVSAREPTGAAGEGAGEELGVEVATVWSTAQSDPSQ